MVYYSGSRIAKSQAMQNQNQGGGDKKSGYGRGVGMFIQSNPQLIGIPQTFNREAYLIKWNFSPAQQAWRASRRY